MFHPTRRQEAWLDRPELSRLCPLSRLIVSDESEAMLNASRALGAPRLVSSAKCLSVAGRSLTGVVSILGDSFNGVEATGEAFRCLGDGGWFVITLPSWEWASTFRSDHNVSAAEFATEASGSVVAPSVVHPVSQQIDLLARAGFEHIDSVSATVADLDSVPPKLSGLALSDPVVRLFVGWRTA